MRRFVAVMERCPDTGLFVGYIPGFKGAHSQGETLDEVNSNLRKVISMLLEDGEPHMATEFVGTQTVTIALTMGGRIPVLKPRKGEALLEEYGFFMARQRE